MRFPHLAGFQQCQLFDTFFSNSAMNEIRTKVISYRNTAAAIGGGGGGGEKAAAGEFWEI